MSERRHLPAQSPRVETAPTKFGDDWCGVFIRGDNAFGYLMDVNRALNALKNQEASVETHLAIGGLLSLQELLSSCRE